MSLGENIREARKAAGLSQEALGEALGVVSQTVSKWERDESSPDAALLPSLAEALGVSLDALFDRTPPERAVADALFRLLRPKSPEERSEVLFRLLRLCVELNLGMPEEEEAAFPSVPMTPEVVRYGWKGKGTLAFFRSASDGRAALLLREPEAGWASLFEVPEDKRLFWTALGDPEVLRAARTILSAPPAGIVERPALGKLLGLEAPERTVPLLEALGLVCFDTRSVDGRETEICFFTPHAEPLALLCLGNILFFAQRTPEPEMYVTGGAWHWVPPMYEGALSTDSARWYYPI